MVMKKIKEKISVKLAESQESLALLAITAIGAIVLMYFGLFKAYPPSAFFAAFTVLAAAVLLIPLILRLAREEGQ